MDGEVNMHSRMGMNETRLQERQDE